MYDWAKKQKYTILALSGLEFANRPPHFPAMRKRKVIRNFGEIDIEFWGNQGHLPPLPEEIPSYATK